LECWLPSHLQTGRRRTRRKKIKILWSLIITLHQLFYSGHRSSILIFDDLLSPLIIFYSDQPFKNFARFL